MSSSCDPCLMPQRHGRHGNSRSASHVGPVFGYVSLARGLPRQNVYRPNNASMIPPSVDPTMLINPVGPISTNTLRFTVLLSAS